MPTVFLLQAIAAAKKRLEGHSDKFIPVNSNFKNFKSVVEDLGYDGLDGILLDLGVSSYQLDNRERGFSYMASETELDMRMNPSQELSAKKVVNEYSKEQLEYILSTYGEERFSSKIAAEIIKRRENRQIQTPLLFLQSHGIQFQKEVQVL